LTSDSQLTARAVYEIPKILTLKMANEIAIEHSMPSIPGN
jgi:hypothetical protein